MGRHVPPFAPLRASNLSRSTGPSSPASPLSPKPPRLTHRKASSISNRSLNTQAAQASLAEYIPVNEPMPWLWVCHKCNTRYPLGSTRRCLYDGHHFCGGTTTNPITGRTKRHRACGSEFDYVGWEEFGYWKEKLQQAADPTRPVPHTKKNCAAQCIYPSACHWRAKEAKAREQRAVQEQKAREQQEAAKKASFDFLDASCFEQDPLYCPKRSGETTKAPSSPPPTRTDETAVATRKKNGGYFKGLVRAAAEKGTSSISTLLNPATTTTNANEQPRQELPRSLRIVDPTKTIQNDNDTTTTSTTQSTTVDTSPSIPSTSLEPTSTSTDNDIEMPDLLPSPTITSSPPSPSSSSSSSSSSSPSTSPLPSPISPLTDPTTTTTTPSRHPSLAFSTDGLGSRETDGAAAAVSPLSPPDWAWLDGASKELGVEILVDGTGGFGGGGGDVMPARRGSAPARGYQVEMDLDDDDGDKEREESMEEWQRGVDAVERRVSV